MPRRRPRPAHGAALRHLGAPVRRWPAPDPVIPAPFLPLILAACYQRNPPASREIIWNALDDPRLERWARGFAPAPIPGRLAASQEPERTPAWRRAYLDLQAEVDEVEARM